MPTSWVTLLAFLRISTNTRIFRQPLSLPEAVSLVSEWLSRPEVGILHPEEGHWARLSNLLATAQATAELVMDAHLAALAVEHGAILCTHDRGFARFPGLRVQFPLEPAETARR